MEERKGQGGAILLVMIIVLAIVGFLFVNGYIQETKKGMEAKQDAQQSVQQIKTDLENTVKEKTEENLEEAQGNLQTTIQEKAADSLNRTSEEIDAAAQEANR